MRALLDLLFPRKCVFCQKLLAKDDGDICADCYRNLPEPHDPVRHGAYFDLCVSPCVYRDAVREAIHRFKFSGRECYAATFAPLMAAAIAQQEIGSIDFVTWAPVSRRRKRSRGYDQAQCLALEVGKLLDLPCRQALWKHRDNAAQSSLDAAARQANVFGVYRAKHLEQLAEQNILLIDDVITTGATLSECSRVLRLEGAKRIVCATFATTESGLKT